LLVEKGLAGTQAKRKIFFEEAPLAFVNQKNNENPLIIEVVNQMGG
jgi:hypothetical protein